MCLVSAAYHPYPSGVSEHVSHLARGLVDLGVEVEVLTTRYAADHDDYSEPAPVVRLGRARMVPLNGSYATLPFGPGLPRAVAAYFGDRAFDVVHCHGVFWPEISYWAIRHSRARRVVSFMSAGFRTTSVAGGLHRRLFARHLARIDGRLALSERARQTYAPYVPGECRIIPSGVDLARFGPDKGTRPTREPGESRLLFVGRIDKRKGLEVLLRAMPAVLEREPGTRLIVVGSGPGTRAARALAASLGLGDRVRFVGRVSRQDLPAYYSGADVYVSPALGGESFGIVLLEAMASGAVVIASDIPGYDETVSDGTDGVLVPPGDSSALAAAAVRLLADERLAGGLRAGGMAKARRHAWPLIAERTLALYLELCAAPSSLAGGDASGSAAP